MDTKTRTMRVLLVDDDALIRRAASRALEAQLGCEVETAASGYEAIALIKFGSAFDVAVIDLEMPGMDGFDLLKLLAQLSPEVALGVWTGMTGVDGVPEHAGFLVHKSQPIRELGYAVRVAAGRPTEVTPRQSVIRQIREDATKRAGNGH